MKGVNYRYFPALTNWRELTLTGLENSLLSYEELSAINKTVKCKRPDSPKRAVGNACPHCKKIGHNASDCWFRPGGPGAPKRVRGGQQNYQGGRPVLTGANAVKLAAEVQPLGESAAAQSANE